jgi:hypothetical protein
MAAVSPCYLNRMEPLELVFGWGTYDFTCVAPLSVTCAPKTGKELEQALRLLLIKRGFNETSVASLLADCLAPPLREIEFPRDL